MTNKVLLKKSSVTDRVPTTSDLDYGELAINYADGKLYFKDSSNNIDYFTSVSAASTTDSFKTISVDGQDNLVADSAIDTLTLVGNNITITTNASTDTITFTGFSGDYDSLTNKPTLSTVATTGSYNDLSDKPTIGSSDPEFNILTRSGELATKLTGLMQNYLDFDATTFRNNVATIITRSATVTVTG